MKFSFIASPTLTTKDGPLSNVDKGRVMSETSGSNTFETVDIEMNKFALDDFLHQPIVFSGHEFKNGKRDTEHYMRTNVLVIDIDEGMTVDQVEEKLRAIDGRPFYHISYSSNHKPNVQDKMHVVIPLMEPVESLEDHELMADWVYKLFPHSDSSVRNDVARGIIRSSPQFRDKTIFGGTSPLFTSLILDEARKDVAVKSVAPLAVEDYFTLDTEVFDAKRNIFTIRDLIKILNGDRMKTKPIRDQKIAIFCPVCGFDTELRSENNPALLAQNSFIRLGKSGIPYINCRSCASRNHGHDKKGSWFLEPEQQMVLSAEKNKSLVFRDILTDRWFYFRYSQIDDEFRFLPLNKATSVRSVIKNELDLRINDIEDIPAFQLDLRYDIPDQFDVKRQFVNKYIPSKIMNIARAKKYDKPYPIPKVCWNIIKHVSGGDEAMAKWFINWLAYIFQYRKKTFVAWLFQGTQGTGKDLLFEHILSPIFGYKYCTSIDQDRLLSRFNTMLSENVLLKVNEIQIDFNQHQEKTAAALKTAIGDLRMQMERKGIDADAAKNIVNLMAFTNKRNSVIIEVADRRWNVCERQEVKLHESKWFNFVSPQECINYLKEHEVQEFAYHLASIKVDPSVAYQPKHTDAKEALIQISKSHTELFFECCEPGNINWEVLEETINDISDSGLAMSVINRFKALPNDHPEKNYMSLNEMRILYENIVIGGKQITKMKFDKLAKQNGMTSGVIRLGDKTKRVAIRI